MNAKLVKELLDACFLAKKAVQTLPPLPDGFVPRHVHVIDAIHQLAETRDAVHVGDVSSLMQSTTPSVTKLIGELEKAGYVAKRGVPGDRRFVAIGLTKKGMRFYDTHIASFHATLADAFADLSEKDCRAAIAVMTALHERIQPAAKTFSKRIGKQ